jgi:hypothetical protein
MCTLLLKSNLKLKIEKKEAAKFAQDVVIVLGGCPYIFWGDRPDSD